MSARVLVIDDEPNLRMMMKLALVHAGYEVETASDGKEGLEKFGDGKTWDAVLLDQRMPGISGIDALKEILNRCEAARLIFITAFGSIDLALEAIQAGASDFLRKPFTPETLKNAVKTVLERPCKKLAAIPVGMACKEFTRTTINGYSFELDHKAADEHSGDLTCTFLVSSASGSRGKLNVILPAYVMELVKAYTDCECMPGENQFWEALCEEELANYLWQNAEAPDGTVIEIEDLSSSLKRWVDSIITVSVDE